MQRKDEHSALHPGSGIYFLLGGMKSLPTSHSYNVALFDVLGFSNRLRAEGVDAIAQKYAILAEKIRGQNAAYEQYFAAGFDESAFWTAEGDIVALQPVEAAFASDSFVVWSHSYFPIARDLPESEQAALAKDEKSGWQFAPVPCDHFLTLCCELVCSSLECGLPLRGAISAGRAIMDRDSGYFLGEPLVEAARLEKAQAALGLGLCSSFVRQHVPSRFTSQYEAHMKANAGVSWSGRVLAWPRHWKHTRGRDCTPVIQGLSDGATAASHYYENTLRMLASFAADPALRPQGMREEYPQFSSPDVTAYVRAVRNVTAPPA